MPNDDRARIDRAVDALNDALSDDLSSQLRRRLYDILLPTPALCRQTEGATGIDCGLEFDHTGDHEGTHTPRTDGTESVGYALFVRWPRNQWDRTRESSKD